MLRKWVLLDLLLTSKVQSAIQNFLVKFSLDRFIISSSMTHISMISTIKGLSHIFRSRLSDRLERPKHSISHPFVNDSIHFFIGAWYGRVLFLLFPFSLLPNCWFIGGDCKSLRSIFFFSDLGFSAMEGLTDTTVLRAF